MLERNYRTLVIFLAIVLLLACVPFTATTPAPPTFDLPSLNTVIAKTAGAAATQTFVQQPTLTPSPTITRTPTEVPSSTPTFLYILPTPTVPSATPTLDLSAGPYGCRILLQYPADNAVFPRKAPFEAHWQVRNTGTSAWDVNSADYRYFGGDELHRTSAVYDFDQSVPTGGTVDFFVGMKAPDGPGIYSTKWLVSMGKERFCPMTITIVVN